MALYTDKHSSDLSGEVRERGNQGTSPVTSESYSTKCYISPGQATCWDFVGKGIVAGVTRSMA